MSQTLACPNCGAQLSEDAPAGLCPKCLVQAGFESEKLSQPDLAATSPSPSSSGFEPPTVEELAQRFPQLEILQLLGKGGMGAVYKARQRGLDRLVAVKILPPEVGADPAFAERFMREARALAQLSHSNIVGVHDFGQAAGLYYFIMEYVDGVNLRQAILAGDMTPKEVLAIVPQICDALQFAHDEGIVHRDIKPENILIDKKGRVKIADFGLAKLLGHEQADHRLTATHQIMGTLRYMAPEQLEGSHEVDHRADIYSLGVVFYELLTGELPIGRFAPPSKKVQIDVRLDEVVLRALEKEPEQRWQHASELKTGVESIGMQPATSRTAPIAPVPQPLPPVNKGRLRRAYCLTAGSAALGWCLLPLLWNAGGIGLFVSCLAIGTLVTCLARKAAQLFPETIETWLRSRPIARWATMSWLVAFAAFGVYLLTIGIYQTWERARWSPSVNSQEEFRRDYQGVEYKLLRGLTAYKKDLPRAEITGYGGGWTAGWAVFATYTKPSIGLFGPFLISGSLSIGLLCIAMPYFAAIGSGPRRSSLPGGSRRDWPALVLACLTVLPLVLYCCALLFVSDFVPRGYELKFVTTKDDLSTTCARIQTWADNHGYVAGDRSTFRISGVPSGELLAQIEIGQLWKPSVFDRWHITRHGLERASPHFAFQVVSDAKHKETIVRLDTSSNKEGTPENEPFIEALAGLTSAIEVKPSGSMSVAEAAKSEPPAPKPSNPAPSLPPKEVRFYALGKLSRDAFDRGDSEEAVKLAEEYLVLAAGFHKDWNYGNAIHNANELLGLVALEKGNVPAAKEYLLAAGKSPGSPQLDSFGPDLELAAALLAKGEKQAVLEYLAAIGKFWTMGKERLARFRKTIEAGATPAELKPAASTSPLLGSWLSKEPIEVISGLRTLLEFSADGTLTQLSLTRTTSKYRVVGDRLIVANPRSGKEEPGEPLVFKNGKLVLSMPGEGWIQEKQIELTRSGAGDKPGLLVGRWVGKVHVEDLGDAEVSQTFDSNESGTLTIEFRYPATVRLTYVLKGERLKYTLNGQPLEAKCQVADDQMTLTGFYSNIDGKPRIFHRLPNSKNATQPTAQ
jgi:predicted Ser/Thr protein kinase